MRHVSRRQVAHQDVHLGDAVFRLCIGDTIALKCNQLTGNNLFLYTQKTGQPVSIPLPDFVVEALKTIDSDGDYLFWTGKNIRLAVAN